MRINKHTVLNISLNLPDQNFRNMLIIFLKYKSNNGQVYLNSKQFLQFWHRLATSAEAARGAAHATHQSLNVRTAHEKSGAESTSTESTNGRAVTNEPS
jgi:hypothetical protein